MSKKPLKTAAPELVAFKGLFEVRLLVGEDGRRRVVPKDIATFLGLDWLAMYRRIERNFSAGIAIARAPSRGGAQDTLTLDLDSLPGLLYGIEVTGVKPELRPRLGEIQRELTAALASYTFLGAAVNPAFEGATRKGPKLLPQKAGDVRALTEKIRGQVGTIGIAGDVGERLLAAAGALEQATAGQDPDAPIDLGLAEDVRALGLQAEQMDSLAELAAKRGKTQELAAILEMLPTLSARVGAAKAQR